MIRVALALALLLLAACSLDYREAMVEEDIHRETPDTVMDDFTHTIVSGGHVTVVLEARQALEYGKKKQTVLKDVRYREFDSDGRLVVEGSADEALFETDSENATLEGSIVIHSVKEKAVLHASKLTWTRDGRVLEGEPQERVRLDKEDGSFVEGAGFRADLRRGRVEFGSAVEGSYVQDEEEQ